MYIIVVKKNHSTCICPTCYTLIVILVEMWIFYLRNKSENELKSIIHN